MSTGAKPIPDWTVRPNGKDRMPTEEPQAAHTRVWPDPIAEEGFHGPAGKLVRLIEPHTEADPAALLVQALVGWGSLLGRGPYYLAEADHHHTNENCVILGITSKGRKGSSLGRIQTPLGLVDNHWSDNCLVRGLGSGEALLEAVSETDKRCLVLEQEFSRALAVMGREGSTLSAMLRLLWDAGQAERRVAGKKTLIQGGHVSLIGHITRDELLRRLSETEIGNGFGNRILWVCARRSRILPHGGGSIDFDKVVRQLKTATDAARKRGNNRIIFDTEARLLWEEKYPELSEGRTGLLGALTSRAEAHVVRLALIYCLLDCSPEIRKVHLQAALAVWNYCFASARFVWGDALGDPTGDSILSLLRATPAGLSRWDLNNSFSRHKSAAELDRALGLLLEQGRVRIEKKETTGRPETVYVQV